MFLNSMGLPSVYQIFVKSFSKKRLALLSMIMSHRQIQKNIALVEKLGCMVHIKYLNILNRANISII